MAADFNSDIDASLLARALGDVLLELKQLYADEPRAAADVARPIYRFFWTLTRKSE